LAACGQQFSVRQFFPRFEGEKLGSLRCSSAPITFHFSLSTAPRSLGQPLLRDDNVFSYQAVGGLNCFDGYVRTALLQLLGDPRQVVRRSYRIMSSSQQQDRPPCEILHGNIIRDKHRPKKNGATQHIRPQQQETLGDICSVRIANRKKSVRGNPVFGRNTDHKVGQTLRTFSPIFDIENAFGETAKESWCTILTDLTARTDYACAWSD
jgi:hypothetical protein